MAGESNVRFYSKDTGERVSHTPKVAHKDDGLPMFVWEPDDERYKKISSGDIFDEVTQQVIPSHATPVRLLSKERYWEAMAPDGEQEHFPSVTQVHNILANDGVVKWQVNNVIQFFMDYIEKGLGVYPDDMNISIADLKQSAIAASSPNDAAERGTRFHNAMEFYVNGSDWTECLQHHEIEPCEKIIAAIDEQLFKRHGKALNKVVEAGFINHEQGVGGTVDRPVESTVYDYKFSDKTLRGKRGGLLKGNYCYPDRALQLASYADGLKIQDPTLTNIFCNVHTGEVEFYDWPDPQRWLYSSRLLNMFYYMFKVGRLPELGDNTAMIMHALEEWQV